MSDRIEDLLRLFDIDKDGLVSVEDMQTVFLSFNIHHTKDEIRAVFQNYAKENANFLNLNEFRSYIQNSDLDLTRNLKVEDEVRELFKLYDRNEDGYITWQDLESYSKDISLPQNEFILKTMEELVVDDKKNGKIDFMEFYKFFLLQIKVGN